MNEITITPVNRLELTFTPRPWPFAEERRTEIAHHFGELQRANPALWNGRVLLLHRHVCHDGVFQGQQFETDFASFMAWRDWGWPDATVKNCFGMGALRGSDGAFLLGVMSARTANAGSIYFPAGMVDPSDIAGGTIDLAKNVLREVEEETGLAPADYAAEEGWHTVFAGPRIAHIKVLQAREPAAALRSRMLAYIASQHSPELSDIRVVRSPSNFDPQMVPFVTAFLSHIWRTEP